MKAMKPETCWMPMEKNGRLWTRWSSNLKMKVVAELNDAHVSWREAGLKVVKVHLTPIRRKSPTPTRRSPRHAK